MSYEPSPKPWIRHQALHFLSYAWLTFVLVAATKKLIRVFPPPDAEINGDAYWTYLPNARKLLDHAWSFLTTDPASYHVAPLGYIWPAIWGADRASIQIANCVLFLACILLAWRAATRLGGMLAGVISTALLVFHPDLVHYIPQVLTEAIFLFGLMLLTTASVEYALGNSRSRLWLGLAATGLAITLLSRPVLQIFTLGPLTLGLGLLAYSTWRHPKPDSAHAALARILDRRVCGALLAALVLPAAVVIKNGLYFDLWGLGTGAGSGLYYGVSPFKMGLEPVYSGFKYDAGITPLTVAPETKGHPLTLEADQINKRVALNIVKNTSLRGNAAFFSEKLKAWFFYSTPELSMSSKLRGIRTFEWLVIGLATLALAARFIRRQKIAGLCLPGTPGMDQQKLTLLIVILLGVSGMGLQLAPVLYNTRYNTFFMEPWLVLLAGVGTAILLQRPESGIFAAWPASRKLQWLGTRVAIVLVLAWVPVALTKYSLRHETWSMDPYRPGPVEVMLDRAAMGTLHATKATHQENGKWRLEANPATLHLPLQVSSPGSLHPDKIKDAMWRLRISVTPPEGEAPRACRKALLTYSRGYGPQDWYEPEPAVYLQPDGAPHTYAIHGNDDLRPAGSGDLSITFHCPPGTVVQWVGAELLRSALPEAARALIHEKRPIDPYLRRDPLPFLQ